MVEALKDMDPSSLEKALKRLEADKEIDKIVGIESRGFIFAAPLAIKLGSGLID